MNKPMMQSASATWMLALSVAAHGAGIDAKTDLACAATEVYECDPAAACRLVPSRDAADIRFLNVDLKNKRVTLAEIESSYSSAIQHVEIVDGKLILQGIDEGRPNERDGGGWTMTIDTTYGSMSFTQAGESAFVGFGSCVPKQ